MHHPVKQDGKIPKADPQPVPGRDHVKYPTARQLPKFRFRLIRRHHAQGHGHRPAVGGKLLQGIAQHQHVRHMIAVQVGY